MSEKLATRSLKQWDRIAARIVELGSKSEMAGGAMLFHHDLSQTILKALRRVDKMVVSNHCNSASVFAIADRGYFSSEEILACEEAGITVTLPKPMTSGIKDKGRFGKQDFRYAAEEDVYICPPR